MADIFAGTEPPRWLEALAKPIDTQATANVMGSIIAGIANAKSQADEKNKNLAPGEKPTSAWEQIPSSIHDARMHLHDPLWDIHQKSAQLNIAQQGLNLQATQEKLNQATRDTADYATDQQTMAEWLGKYNTMEKRDDAPHPFLKSERMQTWYDNLRLADSRSGTRKTIQNDIKNFHDAVKDLNPEDRAGILAMQGGPEGSPSAQQWAAVQAAAKNVRAPVKGTMAELEQGLDAARAAGDTEKVADYRARIKRLTDEGYAEPTIITRDGKTFLGYRKTLKEISTMSQAQKARQFELDSAYKAALASGKQTDIAKAKADLDQFIQGLEPPPAVNKTKSGKGFTIEPQP